MGLNLEVVRLWIVRCDGDCGEEMEGHYDKADAIAIAYADDWARNGELWYCPDCWEKFKEAK